MRPHRAGHRPGEAGFTLIELLVVIIILAILAAVAIPTYLEARTKAQDTATFTLVRNALTVVESAFVEIQDYTQMDGGVLHPIEPSIIWVDSSTDMVDPTVPSIANVTALARQRQVNFYPQSPTVFDVASRSESNNLYGIQVRTTGLAGASYVKVKAIDGTVSSGW